MTYQYDPILGAGRDGKVTLAEQQAGFDSGTPAQKAAFQSAVSGVVTVRISSVLGEAADNVNKINAALSSYKNVAVYGNGYVSGTIYIPSYTTLTILQGSSLTQAPGMGQVMVRTMVNPRWMVTLLTSVGNVVTATIPGHDLLVGEYVSLDWAAEYGYSGTHKITAVSGTAVSYTAFETPAATTATVSPSAATSAHSAGNYIQARRSTVQPRLVINGVLDYSGPSITPTADIGTFGVLFDRCAEPHISVDGCVKNALKYAVCMANFSGGTVGNLNFETSSDGLHLTGPISGLTPTGRASGYTGDNMIGVGTGDYADYLVSEGSVIGCTLPAVHTERGVVDAVRIFGSSLYPIDVTLGKITGAQISGAGLSCVRDTVVAPNGNAWIRTLDFSAGVETSGSSYPVSISSPIIGRVVGKVSCGSNVTQCYIGATVVAAQIDVTVDARYAATTAASVSTANGAVVGHLIVRGKFSSSAQSSQVVSLGAAPDRLDIVGFSCTGGLFLCSVQATVAKNFTVCFSGVRTSGLSRLLQQSAAAGACTVELQGVSASTTADPIINASAGTASVILRGGGAEWSRTYAVSRSASQAIYCYTAAAPCDLSILARADGQVAQNANTTVNNGVDGAIGVGVFACVGAATGSWRRLGTAGGAGHQY